MAFRMLTSRGDCILVENYTYCSAIESATPMGLKCIGLPMDSEGLIPSALENTLANWDPSAHDNAMKPWILYIIPTGQNPTGATQSEIRRRDIYNIAQKHDLYIIEDEPYYFLQMQPYTGLDAPSVPPPASHEEFLSSLVPSYLSMDTDGRVMRLDSFSKVIAPGARTGWITASEQIVERYLRHSEVTTQCPSGISQLVLFKLLDEAWGHSGFLDWMVYMRMEYTARRDDICGACEKWLPQHVAVWDPPVAGMFVSTYSSLACKWIVGAVLIDYLSSGFKFCGASIRWHQPKTFWRSRKRSPVLGLTEVYSLLREVGSVPSKTRTSPKQTPCSSA